MYIMKKFDHDKKCSKTYYLLYCSNLRRCIFVYTNNTNHVIKLEEKYFLLENSEDCTLDYVALYDSSGKCAPL